jgi:DNA-binding MarR family transcriptional regulator
VIAMGKLLKEIRQTKPFGSAEEETLINLYRTADVLMSKEIEFLKAYEITSAQYNVLRILRGAGPEGRNCSEISERMIRRDPDVTKLLDRLEDRGFVTRERLQTDRRIVVARITGAGLSLLKKIDRPIQELYQRLLSHMGKDRLKLLSGLLDEAREHAQ